ncbi:hypothetical protein Tco_0973214 [Tanacetum coccineum]
MREDEANAIFGVVVEKLINDWFNGTSEDEDDLEGIIDYLEPTSYHGFTDLDNESYKKSKLLSMTYRTKDNLTTVRARLMGEMDEEGKVQRKRFSAAIEVEFEVTLTRIHVVKMFLSGRNHSSYTVTDDVTM